MTALMGAPTQTIEVYIFRTKPRVRYLLLRRHSEEGGFWQPITGRREPTDSNLTAAVLREVREETGIQRHERLVDTGFTFRFTHAGTHYEEHCFGLQIPDQSITLSPEHVTYRWVSYQRALQLLKWPNNRRALRELHQTVQTSAIAQRQRRPTKKLLDESDHDAHEIGKAWPKGVSSKETIRKD